MFFKSILFGVIFFATFNSFLLGKQIQFIPSLVFQPTWKTQELKALKNLNGIWKTPSDEIYRVPFVEDEKKELILRKEFFFKNPIKDTLFLYFEGISWEAAIYLNGKLLSIHTHPFNEILIPIPPQLFNIQWNWIEVHLKKFTNQTDQWWIPSYIGIHKSVFLLQKDQPKKIIQNAYLKTDSVLIYFPLSSQFKYNISEKDLKRDLEFMKTMGVKAIYIPYSIPNLVKKHLNNVDIYLVDDYRKAKYIAIYRSHSETSEYPFWLKENNEKSNFLGKYVAIDNNQLFKTASELSKPLIVFCGLIVLVLLLIFRIVNFENYKNLWILFPSIRKLQSMVQDPHLINSLSLNYISLVRLIIKSLVISLFINQLHSTDNLKILNFWHKNNTIYNFSKEYGDSVGDSFLMVFIFLLMVNGIKIIVWQFVEWVYNLRGYRNKNLIIDVYGEMPFLFYAFLGLIAMMLVGGYFWLSILVLSFLFTIIKRIYFVVRIYNLNYKIPFSVIFFYLCALELLPWLLII